MIKRYLRPLAESLPRRSLQFWANTDIYSDACSGRACHMRAGGRLIIAVNARVPHIVPSALAREGLGVGGVMRHPNFYIRLSFRTSLLNIALFVRRSNQTGGCSKKPVR